jgi:hypothetical protein
MKLLFAALMLVSSLSAFAQKHMVQIGTDNTTIGNLSWQSEKTRGSNSEEQKAYYVFANYAMTLTDHLQAGAKVELSKFTFGDSASNTLGLQVGGIYNLNTDFRKSLYASLYVGWDWGHEVDDDFEDSRTEAFSSTLAVGQRFPLTFISENVTYSPEIAYVTTNPTKSSDTEWTQSLEFRILQFSVFF